MPIASFGPFLAAVLLLLALPVAVLGQVLFGANSETVVHLVGAIGFVLLAPAFFDFALPRWVAWAGAAPPPPWRPSSPSRPWAR